MNFSLDDEIAKILSEEITKQIDAEIGATLLLTDLIALNKILRNLGRLITVSAIAELPYNGALNLPEHQIGRQFDHRLSWRKQLGANTNLWKKRIKQFQPSTPWSHSIDYKDNDAVFYFASDEDQVQFLMLMR